jgi:hypothetical protein
MNGPRHRNESEQNRSYRNLGNADYGRMMSGGRGTHPSYQTAPSMAPPPSHLDPAYGIPPQHQQYQPPPMNNPYSNYYPPQPPRYPPQYQYPQYQDYDEEYQPPPAPKPKPYQQQDKDAYEPQTKPKPSKNSGGIRDFSENGNFILKP